MYKFIIRFSISISVRVSVLEVRVLEVRVLEVRVMLSNNISGKTFLITGDK